MLLLSDYVRILKGMDTITLNAKQQRRADILARTLAGSLTKEEAISLLHCTSRHLRRLLHSYQEKKLASVVHGNHLRIPVNKTDSETLHTIIKLAGEGGKYHDFNTSHLCYLLKREERSLRPGGGIRWLFVRRYVACNPVGATLVVARPFWSPAYKCW